MRFNNSLISFMPGKHPADTTMTTKTRAVKIETVRLLPLKAAYEILSKDFPKGEWTKRAYPYRLIG